MLYDTTSIIVCFLYYVKGFDMYFTKYHSKKTEYNGIIYDSKKESKRAFELDMMQRGGIIKDLQRQVRFTLQDKYRNNQGKAIREISYLADFYYFDIQKDIWVVEDVKSPATRTQVYLVKKKLFEYKYPEILFIES